MDYAYACVVGPGASDAYEEKSRLNLCVVDRRTVSVLRRFLVPVAIMKYAD